MRLQFNRWSINRTDGTRGIYEAKPDGPTGISVSSEGEVIARFPAPDVATRWTEAAPLVADGETLIFGAKFIRGVSSVIHCYMFRDGIAAAGAIEDFRQAAVTKSAASLSFAAQFVSFAPYLGAIAMARTLGSVDSGARLPVLVLAVGLYIVAAAAAARYGGRALISAKKSQHLVGLKCGLICLGVFAFCVAAMFAILGPIRLWLVVGA